MLDTEHLILRPVVASDFERLYEIYRNPKVMRYIHEGHVFSFDKAKQRVDGFVEQWQKYNFGMYLLVEKISHEPIGYCGFRYFKEDVPELKDEIELGYILDEPYWGKGYASEAVHACIQIGFETFHFKRILATILSDNIASQKAATKYGMKYNFDLSVHGLVHEIYEITADEYQLNKFKIALSWITNILQTQHIPFQIAGGLAARAYGAERTLNDIDIDIPQEQFTKLKDLVAPFITLGPEPCKTDKYDLLLMTLHYQGQEIDISSADQVKVFDEKTQAWIDISSDLSDISIQDVLGLSLPVIPRASLLYYKKILARATDLQDVREIENYKKE